MQDSECSVDSATAALEGTQPRVLDFNASDLTLPNPTGTATSASLTSSVAETQKSLKKSKSTRIDLLSQATQLFNFMSNNSSSTSRRPSNASIISNTSKKSGGGDRGGERDSIHSIKGMGGGAVPSGELFTVDDLNHVRHTNI